MKAEFIRQTEAAECGLACLAIVSSALGAEVAVSELRRRFPVSARGMSVSELMETAAGISLSSRPVRCELEEMETLKLPAILHWKLNHYVVLLRVGSKGVRIHDPALGLRTLSWRDMNRHFTGVAIEFEKTSSFQKRKVPSELKLSTIARLSPSGIRGLVQVLVLSLILQIYVVASPFYMRLAIDEAALKGDAGLLSVLAFGFGLFALFNVSATALRSVALQKITTQLGWDMTGRVFHHMIRLPLQWFQRRRLADALTRFQSIDPVRNLISNGLVSSIIDGALSLVTLAMMFLFAWPLALVALIGTTAYVACRLAAMPMMIRLGGDALVASIAEQGKRIETLRAIQTIKVMGGESQREGDWSNRYAESLRAVQANGLATIGVSSIQSFIEACTAVCIIYLGARSVIDGTLTVGTLYAFIAYRTQFSARTQGLFDQVVNWRMLDLHSDRLADIVMTPTDAGVDDGGQQFVEMKGAIEIRNLSFRYAPQESPVFSNLNTTIKAGEFVALVGPSGVGKSTLLKVICGLYPPTGGDVRIDGRSLSSWGAKSVRRNLGVVLQDDELIAGTIAENVAFFADDINMELVWDALAKASIIDEVRAMPMKAESFVGDMGAALSGGQKQRILLARALYRQPKILVLDEATSHLDVQREKAINAALQELNITRLVIAHRPETIAAADRVLTLQPQGIFPVAQVSGPAAPNPPAK